MYILVQWINKPYDVTVMEETENVKNINEGQLVEIEYPNKGIFKATLIQRSGKNDIF